jgi:putative DNA primase/helicase
MSERIFATHAPAYWAAGLPVVPLIQRQKRPCIDAWEIYHSVMPTEGEQSSWVNRYPDANIGLVLGAQSGLVMLDIDTEEQALQKVILDVLSPFPSPWIRVGSKGMVLAYRQPVGGLLKTFRINRLDRPKGSNSVIEGLSTRTQVVLPPSIHPKGMIYQANGNLWEMLDQLPYLPADIEHVLRQAIMAEGVELSHSGNTKITEFVSSGGRDNAMVRQAGYWAKGVTKGEISLLQGIGFMHTWAESLVEKVAGDDVDVDKGEKQFINFVTRDVLEKKKTLPPGWDAGLSEEQKTHFDLIFTHEHEEWTYEQIMAYLQAEFEKHGGGGEGWLKTIEYILERLSRSKGINGIYEEQILSYISESMNKKLTKATLRKRMNEHTQGELKGEDHTEIAKAALVDLSAYGELRYHVGVLWQWRGSHWEKMTDEKVLRVIAENYGSLSAARRRSDHRGIAQILSTLCVEPLVRTSVSGVNFANGFLTEDLKLLPHNPDFGATYTMPFRYIPEAGDRAVKWLGFLDRCFSDPVDGDDVDKQQKIDAIQEAMCATIFGKGPSLSRAILLYGLSSTGKSEMLKVVQELVPDSARCSIPPTDWGDKFLPAQLTGKLLNVAGELSENKKISGKEFKDIIVGGVMTGQNKNGQPFDFCPIATHWFASNHKPTSLDFTDGFNRRWLIIHFKNRISAAERILDISSMLIQAEREEIVSWAVQAMARLNRQGYTIPSSHEELINEVANSNNSVRFFLKEGGVITVHPAPVDGSKTLNLISEGKLYDAYSSFCLVREGVKRVGSEPFRDRMRELEREVGFRIRMEEKPTKEKFYFYDNLTLAVSTGK